MRCLVSRGAAQEERRIAKAAMRTCRATMSILPVSFLPTIKSEEFLCSCGRCASDFFHRNSAGAGNLFRDQSGVSRLAAFSAIRDRRQIRTIGFDHKTFHRHASRDFANLFPIFECHDSGEGNEMAKIENFVRLLERAAKAMKYAADLPAVVAQDRQGVVPCVALMN